ncbi:hypothetical protein CSKR_109658 [Clonorchis sinensis]|uniref:Uncharacterized protein n=1 Tax=Clonorchis sinensis TaxID=79923 RepID=A0A419PSY1_CLOSI|nr:hypothetical protein CSKR_109658 [Clonorchis sinensis]
MPSGFCGNTGSEKQSSSYTGAIILVSPHQREEAMDSSFALIRAHQQCISYGCAEVLTPYI